MFTVDPNITDLQVKEKIISKAYFSMNSPQIATPELSVEEARCYILFFRTGNTYSLYIGLYLPNSERRFYYTYSGNPVPEEGVGEALDEATRFAEEMGFLLDELKLTNLSIDERNQWIEDQAIFGYKKKTEEKPKKKPEARPAEKAEAKSVEEPAAAEQPLPPVEPQPIPAEQRAAAPLPSTPQPEAAQPPEGLPAADWPDMPPIQTVPAAAGSAPPKKAALPKQPPATARRAPQLQPEVAPPGVPQEQEELVQPAAKAAAVKPQKPRARKTVQSSTGTVSREYEALARLLASF